MPSAASAHIQACAAHCPDAIVGLIVNPSLGPEKKRVLQARAVFLQRWLGSESQGIMKLDPFWGDETMQMYMVHV